MSKKTPYDILVAREYTDANGEVKTAYYRAGVAFENSKEGMNGEVVDGLALTGRFIIAPRRDRAPDDGASHDEPA